MGLRTGEEYRESIRDGREVYYDGDLVKDITTHPAFKPIIDVRSRMYDMQNEAAFADATTFDFNGEPAARSLKPPTSVDDLSGPETLRRDCPHRDWRHRRAGR